MFANVGGAVSREIESSRKRWARFEAWEAEQLVTERRPLTYWIQWLNDAREMASRMVPGWDSTENAQAHWKELARAQRELSRVRFGR